MSTEDDADKEGQRRPALLHGAPQAPPRQPKPGLETWRLRHPDGRIQRCELRDDSMAGAGWDVMQLENGEPLFSRRWGTNRSRYVAEAAKKDLLRTGWAESLTAIGSEARRS